MDKKSNSWLMLLSLFLISVAEAKSNTLSTAPNSSSHWYPYSGRIEGTSALSNSLILNGDGMLPLYGNRNSFLFGDLQGGYGTVNDSYVASPGGGYRQVFDNHIWGFYVFADYQQPNPGGHFWTLSPGIEWMSPRWDAHTNLYFPTTNKQAVGSPVYADSIGDYSQVSFSGHDQIDALVTPYAAMSNGGDVEFGYSLEGYHGLRSRLYAGAYYYAPPNVSSSYITPVSAIRGLTFGVQVPLNKIFTLAVSNSNDNVNNNIASISLSMTLGGYSSELSHDVHDRLLDTVQRHVGIIGTGAGAYAQKPYAYSGTGVQYSNVYFVSPDGTGDGTYGNPAPLTQDTLDGINTSSPDDARLYLQGGAGTTYNVTTLDGLKPYNGQNFYGRSFDYSTAAVGNDRPTLFLVNNTDGYQIFHLDVNGATNTFSDLQFTTDFVSGSNAGVGLFMTGGLTDTTINNSSFSNFRTALYLPNNADLSITDSSFTNNNTVINSSGSDSNFIIQDTTITADSGFDFGGTQPGGIQVTNTGGGTVNFTASLLQINLNNNNSSAGLSFTNQFDGQINATINNSTITGAGSGGNNGLEIRNGIGSAGSGGTITVAIQNSLIENNGQAANTGNIYIQANNSGIINFSFINSTSSQGHSYGLLVVNGDLNPNLGDTVNVAISNSTFDGSGQNIGSPYAFGNIGVWSLGQGTINFAATNSTISNTTLGAPALWVSNGLDGGSISDSTINISDLSGTTFLNNNWGGIYAYAGADTTTSIDYTGAIFTNSTPNIANDPASTGTINWDPAGP